jgi:hypothetical protein
MKSTVGAGSGLNQSNTVSIRVRIRSRNNRVRGNAQSRFESQAGQHGTKEKNVKKFHFTESWMFSLELESLKEVNSKKKFLNVEKICKL